MKSRIIPLLFLFFLAETLVGQPLFSEDFEKALQYNRNKAPRVYVVQTYTPLQRSPVPLSTDNKDPLYENYYADDGGDDSSAKHGFYTSLLLYDRTIPFNRDVLVVQLDPVSVKGKSLNIGLDVLYPKGMEYHVDSLYMVLLAEEKDVRAWFTDKRFLGQYVGFSLGEANNRSWKRINAGVVPDREYKYLLIGNLKTDESCRITKVDACVGCPRSKRDRQVVYSDLLIDNIVISAGGN